MDTALSTISVVVALTVLNVWVLRFNRPTQWRGGAAQGMREEFQAYELPLWLLGVVGFLKVCCAALLIMGIWIPEVTKPAAGVLGLLMACAVSMHIKIKDPPRKLFPALCLLALSVTVAVV